MSTPASTTPVDSTTTAPATTTTTAPATTTTTAPATTTTTEGKCCLKECAILRWESPMKTGVCYALTTVAYLIVLGSQDPLGWSIAFAMWIAIPAGLLFKFNVLKAPACCKGEKKAECCDAKTMASKAYDGMVSVLRTFFYTVTWQSPMYSAQVFVLYVLGLKIVHHFGFSCVVFMLLQVLFFALPVASFMKQREMCVKAQSCFKEHALPKLQCARTRATKCYGDVSKMSKKDLMSWENPRNSAIALAVLNVAILSISCVAHVATHMFAKLVLVIFAVFFTLKSLDLTMPGQCVIVATMEDHKTFVEDKLTKLMSFGLSMEKEVHDVFFWAVPAKTVGVVFVLYVLATLLSFLGLTGLVLVGVDAYLVRPFVVKQPIYKEKVEPVLGKAQDFLKEAEARLSSMMKRAPKPKAE